jgi:hypothetical protein
VEQSIESSLRHKSAKILRLTCTFAGSSFCGEVNPHGQGVELDIRGARSATELNPHATHKHCVTTKVLTECRAICGSLGDNTTPGDASSRMPLCRRATNSAVRILCPVRGHRLDLVQNILGVP